MVLREKDDADYHYNQYINDPTQENLDQLIKYRLQDEYDAINKKISLDFIKEELKNLNFGFPKMVEKTDIKIKKIGEKEKNEL